MEISPNTGCIECANVIAVMEALRRRENLPMETENAAIAAVVELIEADHAYDQAQHAWDEARFSNSLTGKIANNFEEATMRRIHALARVDGTA